MTKKIFISLLLISISALYLSSCSVESKKMTVTTSSKEALKHYQKGLELVEKFRNEEAAVQFQKAIQLDSNFVMAYFHCVSAIDKQDTRVQYLTKAISLASVVSEGEQIFIKAIEAKFINNDNDTYLENLNRLSSMFPEDERLQVMIGGAYYETKDYQTAIKHYNKAVEISPEYSLSYNMLGYTYSNLQNYNEAVKMFEKYIELIPNDPNPYDSYAELLLKRGDFDKSIENYSKALEINPYFYHSHLGIASNLNYKGEHTDARNQLQEFFRTAKSNSAKRIALQGMITSYVDEGDYESAMKMYQKKLNFDTKNDDSISIMNDLNGIANLNYEAGDLKSAAEYFDQAKTFLDNSKILADLKDNSNHFYYFRKALIEVQSDEIELAHESAKTFLDYASNSSNPNMVKFGHQLTGLMAYYENDFKTAEVELRQANQENPYILYFLGLVYENTGEQDKALSFFDKAANANIVNSLPYSFIRLKAVAKQTEQNI